MPDNIDFTGNLHFFSCERLFSGREASPAWSATGERSYVQRYRVIVKHKEVDQLSVCRCPGLPVIGSFYITPTSFDLLAILSEVSAAPENDDDWQNWIVTVRYSTVPPPGGFPIINQQPGTQDNPENDPPDIEWDAEVVQHSPRYDLDGWLYKNMAGQLYKDASFPTGVSVLSITRNELQFNVPKAILYNFAVNSDMFLGFPPGTAQCQPPKAKVMFRGTFRYVRVSYRIHFGFLLDQAEGIRIIKPNGEFIDEEGKGDYETGPDGSPIGLRKWQPQLINEGTKFRPGMGQAAIRETKDSTVDKVLLDQHGRKLLANDAALTPRPIAIRFRQFRALSFTSLVVSGLA